MKESDFEFVKLLGRGKFGKVKIFFSEKKNN